MNTYGFEVQEIKPNLYKVSGKFTPADMTLSVVNEGGQYRAYCNYKKQSKNAAIAYQSNHLTDTAQETIEHCLMSLSTENNNSPDEFQWVKVE